MMKFEKVVVWGSTAAVTSTGVAYGWMKYMMQSADPFAIVNHPLQQVMLKIHIVTAPILIFGIGMILLRHIWPHFRNGLKAGRRSGIWSALITLPMIATGYAIQVLTSASWLRVIGYLHLGLGLIFGAAALVHAVATRRKQRLALVAARQEERRAV